MISINSKYPETIYRNEMKGYTHYTIGLVNKKLDGTFEKGFMNCRFKKGIELQNKEQIIIKNGFISFYKTRNNDTVPLLFITDFDIAEKEESPFKGMGKEIEINDEDIPF